MHSVEIFAWDHDNQIHGILIGANLLLLISLIIRFEWPLIKKRFKSSDENHIENNIKHNEISLSNVNRNTNINKNIDLTERSLPLSGLPDVKNTEIQLTKIGQDIEIEEEKYAYSQEVKQKGKEKEKEKEKEKDIERRRRKKSMEFYHELFNIHYNETDNNTNNIQKPIKRYKRIKKDNTTNNNNTNKLNRRNDSMNLREHQKSSIDIDNIDDDILVMENEEEVEAEEFDEYYNHRNNIDGNIDGNNDDILSVRFRYRYILYLPLIIFILSGVINIIYSSQYGEYFFINYGYPIFSIILSIVLWFEIDIVILSCGGSHIVEECLEVQISANGHEYKCIYCCWCDLSILKFCNCCTMDNGYSLFKCHHKFMKILICLICPLLTIVLFIISDFELINQQLINIEINDIINMENGHTKKYNDITLWYLIFVIISILYLILIFTATYIGILIVKTLYFVSSLNTKTLILQYINSIILTFIMQIQFIILLVYYNIIFNNTDADDIVKYGLCVPTSFYMILLYIEFIIASILNHFAFQNIDFNKFGKEAIEKNKVQLFDFKPDFNNIHDLHNYRRVIGDKFLLQSQSQSKIKKIIKPKSKPKTKTQTQTQQIHTQTKTEKPKNSNIKLESVLLNPTKDNETQTTNKETKHNYPHTDTNTHSSLDLTSQYSSSPSSSSYIVKKKIKRIASEIP